MNLTKLFVAGLCFTAMTASAAYVKTNAFETGEDQTGWWVGDSDTLSTRSVTNDSINGRSDYAGATPLTGTANERVLKLDTEGAVWTNEINEIYANEEDTLQLYTDMLVKFVPSEDLPDVSSLSGKLALAVKDDGTGTNRLNISWYNDGFSAWSEISSKVISTTSWHRVTVRLYTTDAGQVPRSTVFLDGDQVFDQAINGGGLILNSIGFQGTGYIDEVVVRDDSPFGGAATLTLSFSTGVGSVYVGATQKLTTETVSSGDTLIIAAANFYEIASVEGATLAWVGDSGINQTGGVVTVTSTTNATVTITAQAETSATPYAGSGSFTNAPANLVAPWAISNLVSTLTEGIYDDYLFNVATNSNPTLMINSISVSDTTATVTVGAGTVDLKEINGYLKLSAYPVLGGTATNYPSVSVPVSTNNVTITQDIGTNKFIKARIDIVQ